LERRRAESIGFRAHRTRAVFYIELFLNIVEIRI